MNEQAPLYRVVGVKDIPQFDPTRGSYRAKQVDYMLADGTASYVIIPLDQYNKETLEEALQDAAAKHADVMSLQGPLVPKRPAWAPNQGKIGP